MSFNSKLIDHVYQSSRIFNGLSGTDSLELNLNDSSKSEKIIERYDRQYLPP